MKFAGLNAARGLSSEERLPGIVEGLDQIDADIVIVSEAYDQTGQPIDDSFAKKLGYEIFSTEYEDQEPHPGKLQYLVALSRVAIEPSVVRLNTRNAIHAYTRVEGEQVSLYGSHFEDRNRHLRNGMAESLIEQYDPSLPTAIVGDINDTHGGDRRSRRLSSRPVRRLANAIPHPRLHSLATRTVDMASGEAIKRLEAAGLQDADPSHTPTMLLGKRAVLQLDHILHNDKLRTDYFQTYPVHGTDHKAIAAYLSLK